MPSPSKDSAVATPRPRRSRPLRAVAVLLSLVLVSVFGIAIAAGRAPGDVAGFDPTVLTRIEPRAASAPPADVPKSAVPVVLEAIPDFLPAERSFAPRPAPDLPQAVGVIVKATPRPKPPPGAGGSARAFGSASWYCLAGTSSCHYQYPGGMYAAAGPALRVGDWRGRTVRVCGSGSCVSVRLIDWCACPTRVIDLYSDAFRRLAPLSSGTVRVTISW